MAKQKYLPGHRPGTFKRKIPAALVAVFGRTEVWKSLSKLRGESDESKRRHLTAQLNALFERARDEATPGELSPKFVHELEVLLTDGRGYAHGREPLAAFHVAPLVARYRAAMLTTEADELAAMDDADLAAREVELQDAEVQLRRAVTTRQLGQVSETARLLLALECLTAVQEAPEYRHLLDALLAEDLKVVQEQRARLRGEAIVLPAPPAAARDQPTLSSLVPFWAKKMKVRPGTEKTIKAVIREFEAKFGQLPLANIGRETALEFRTHLVGQGQSRNTVRKKLDLLGAIYTPNVLERHFGLTERPFRNVPVWEGDAVGKVKERRAFRYEELQTFFGSPVYRDGMRRKGGDGEAQFWLPLISLFTGAREEEIAQLRVHDVDRFNGVWAIRFVDEGELMLKNASSYRWVPLHHELLRCGLLEYRAVVKEEGYEPLFPQMERGGNDKFSDNFSKFFGRYLDKVVGLDDPSVDFHAFRWTFKTQCTVCGIRTEVEDALTGHTWANSSEGRKYKRQSKVLYPFPPLVEAIRQLRYDEVDLTHLHICDVDGNRLAKKVSARDES